jgi:hypothetical protein
VTTYKEIQGISVQTVAGDPPAPLEGQIWYNSSTDTFKVYRTAEVGSWATGNDLNTAREALTGAGTQTSSLATGGETPTITGATETYNGTNWTEVNDLNTARYLLAAAGADNTSALVFGGLSPLLANTESWNGTNWTEVNDLNTTKFGQGDAGTQTAALSIGGDMPSPAERRQTESWNGTNWTEVNDLNTFEDRGGSFGTQTSALVAAGNGSETTAESWNGTNWSSITALNTPRSLLTGAGNDNTSGIVFGGYSGVNLGNTEQWNGSAWSEQNDLNTSRRQLGASGTTSLALAFGGTPPVTAATEEWATAPAQVTQTITEV